MQASSSVSSALSWEQSLLVSNVVTDELRYRTKFYEKDVLILVISGQFELEIANKQHIVNAGQGIYLRSGSYLVSNHLAEDNGRFQSIEISICSWSLQHFISKHGKAVAEQYSASVPSNSSVIIFDAGGLIEQSITSICSLFKYDHPENLRLLKIEELLLLLLYSPQGGEFAAILRQSTSKNAIRLRQFMETHFMQLWSLEQYAKEFGASLTTFKEMFDSEFGMSPRAWINEKRLQYAHELLLTSNVGIVDVAFEAGFSSQSYFTQAYRRRFGITPSQARKMQ
ncbi:helix-turn-helix transcriptional regulator [Endozoicomonas sp. SM1973]|uniref:Helix-turn-helix transcriptional regulator n=1 Tax=Spartinivicinus marinus TaxID=2994442 RepID=A0A853I114_9GAMM|nr:AraC family transcriptional regulator [Spartinivicinus marinus]MCX4024664.1 AraC family transcriptional regulator [Spartinivicinus marinus]NYZ66309.1 helix-turn-helix transcriptional regulator [Spartinivicinus marinus]